MLRSDPRTSSAVRDALNRYFVAEVDDGTSLRCPRRERGSWGVGCESQVPDGRNFATGQASYVGDHYVLTDDMGPLRILVIGMQTGEDRAHTTMAFRATQVLGAAARAAGDSTRHMDATAAALGVLLGLGPGEDSVQIHGRTHHVFECFALANAALCSSAKPGAGVAPGVGRGGSPPDAFYVNCQPHLKATIAHIRPTIVVVQGRRTSRRGNPGPSPSGSLQAVAQCKPVDGDDQVLVAETRLPGHDDHRFVAVLFPHPGVNDARSWQAGWDSKYFKTDVAPRLHAARSLAASEL